MQPLQNCIGPTIRIGREIFCLPYAGFFTAVFTQIKIFAKLLKSLSKKNNNYDLNIYNNKLRFDFKCRTTRFSCMDIRL